MLQEEVPSSCGLLFDDLPLITTAQVRPYVIAILLHRGAVRSDEIVASLVPHCRVSDLKVGAWDPLEGDYCESTRLEKIIEEVLGEFIFEGIVRYNESNDLYVLTSNRIPTVISWVASLGARMPQHLLMELSREQFKRIPDYIEIDLSNLNQNNGTDCIEK